MAKKVDKKPAAVTEDEYRKFMADICASKQKCDDASTANAQAWKRADNIGVHKEAAKLIQRLRKMDVSKRDDFLRAFRTYLGWEQFDEQPDMFDQPEEGVLDPLDLFKSTIEAQRDEERFVPGCLIVIQAQDEGWYAFNESAKYLADIIGRKNDLEPLETPDLGVVSQLRVNDENIEKVAERAAQAGHMVLEIDINGDWYFIDPVPAAAE